MRQSVRLLFALSLLPLSFIALGCEQQGAEVNAPADIAAINGLIDSYASTLVAGDLEGWMALWAEDGIRMPPDAPAHVGKEKIEASVKPPLEIYDWQLTLDNQEIEVAGNWGFAQGNYTFTLTPKSEGQIVTGIGKYLTVVKKQPDGSWKLFRDCYNNDAPPQITDKE